MAIPTIVRYQLHDLTATFRVEGRGTMAHSLPIRRQVEQFLEAGIRTVRMDLRDCSYMDSTFLGTLLTLRRTVEKRLEGQFALLMPSVACVKLLQQMGLADILPVETQDANLSDNWVVLACEVPADLTAFKRNVLQAHEVLAEVPGETGEQFKPIVRCMQQADPSTPPADKKE